MKKKTGPRRREVAAVALCALLPVGCAQTTTAPIEQSPMQDVITPTTTDQDSAAQGSTVNVWVINAPGENGVPSGEVFHLDSVGGISGVIQDAAGADGATLKRSDAGYAMSNISIAVHTGNTTPSLSGTTTATAAGTQSPTATPTITPTQDIRPRISASIPIAIAPAGIADAAATSGAGEGPVSSDKKSDNQLQWARVLADPAKLDSLLNFLNGFFKAAPPPSPPPDVKPPDEAKPPPDETKPPLVKEVAPPVKPAARFGEGTHGEGV